MSQSTPTALTKRKVMGRMDSAPSESPSSSVTPNARPRIVRAHHGYSSPSLSNNVTPTATRPTAGTGRARVDMSAFASPSSVASSPAMSPSLNGRPMSASSAASNTITARLSAPSPTVRSTPSFHTRTASNVSISSSAYKLGEASIDPNLASLRSPKIRARNGSIDFGSSSPSVASPSPRVSASPALRSPLPRTDQSPFQKPSTPSTSTRPAASIPPRSYLSPQRSQETLDRPVTLNKNRAHSPNLTAASQTLAASTLSHQTSPPKPRPVTHNSEPIISARQVPISVPAPASVKTAESTSDPDSTNSSATAQPDDQIPFSSDARPFHGAATANRIEPGSAMTTGRAGLRHAPVLQRAAIPPSFMDLATVTTPIRSDPDHRNSFTSSALSALSAGQPLSPSSETPRSPSEGGEAEEARFHRKLLDLEITNRSLLAINSALEVTKLKQAKEIRELKRRLRDGRGPPVATNSRESAGSTVFSDDDDLTESEDDDELLIKEDPELEASHQRCKDLIDNMVGQARKAILAEYVEPENTGGKVLHPAELEEMQRELDEEGNDTEADTTVATDLLDASITFDRSSAEFSKDDALPSSSSLKFTEENVIDGPTALSSSHDADDIIPGVNPEAGPASHTGLHPNSAYGGNIPSHADVSID